MDLANQLCSEVTSSFRLQLTMFWSSSLNVLKHAVRELGNERCWNCSFHPVRVRPLCSCFCLLSRGSGCFRKIAIVFNYKIQQLSLLEWNFLSKWWKLIWNHIEGVVVWHCLSTKCCRVTRFKMANFRWCEFHVTKKKKSPNSQICLCPITLSQLVASWWPAAHLRHLTQKQREEDKMQVCGSQTCGWQRACPWHFGGLESCPELL